jgi:hypothetical protein
MHAIDCPRMCAALCLCLQPVDKTSVVDKAVDAVTSTPPAVLANINAAATRALWLEDHLADVSGGLCVFGGRGGGCVDTASTNRGCPGISSVCGGDWWRWEGGCVCCSGMVHDTDC